MDICRTVVTKCKFVLVRLQVYSRRHITRSPMILQSNFGRFNKRENKTSPDRNAILITAYRVFYSSVRNESFGQTNEKPMPWRCNATASLYDFFLCFHDLSQRNKLGTYFKTFSGRERLSSILFYFFPPVIRISREHKNRRTIRTVRISGAGFVLVLKPRSFWIVAVINIFSRKNSAVRALCTC